MSRKGLFTEYSQEWWECGDIRVIGDDGELIYSGPKWTRCAYEECGELVTAGQVHDQGQCQGCGGRRLRIAAKLRDSERMALWLGHHILCEWERELIHGRAKKESSK